MLLGINNSGIDTHMHAYTHKHAHTHAHTYTHTNSILKNQVNNSIQPKHTWFKSDCLLRNFSLQDQFSKAMQEDWESKIAIHFSALILHTTKV